MAKRQPLYPHIPKSEQRKQELPEFLIDELFKASGGVRSVIDYLEVQRGDLLAHDPTVRKVLDDLKKIDTDLIRKRAWVNFYKLPSILA